jgi:hypothetical protein
MNDIALMNVAQPSQRFLSEIGAELLQFVAMSVYVTAILAVDSLRLDLIGLISRGFAIIVAARFIHFLAAVL